MAGARSALWGAFAWLFLPEGYPDSVAPEYASYQLWDTIQQVTYFINTVISLQAIMTFHGVGNPKISAAEATALSMGRGLLGSIVSLFFTVPSMTHAYKNHVRSFRLLSEVVSAVGHFFEILAASFPIPPLLYGGPALLSVSGAMGGAARSVIMTHFARQQNNGDVSLKESNQDKGGKIFGLAGGVAILLWVAHGSNPETIFRRSAIGFGALSVVHILGNVAAVMVLEIPATPLVRRRSSESCDRGTAPASDGQKRRNGAVRWLKQFFLPPGYPHSLDAGYTKYHLWQALCDLTNYPKGLVTQLMFWGHVYGVGNASKTPLDAVYLNIFMTSVSCFVGLASGVPSLAKNFYGNHKAWRFRSSVIGPVLGDTLYLMAAAVPQRWFYVLIVLSVSLQSLAGVARKVVDAEIMKNWSRSPEVELVHISVASRNQSVFVQMSTASLSLAYAYYLVDAGPAAMPTLTALLPMYAFMQSLKVLSAWGASLHTPDAVPPTPDAAGRAAASLAEPLLPPAAPSTTASEGEEGADQSFGDAFNDLASVPTKGVAVCGSSQVRASVES